MSYRTLALAFPLCVLGCPGSSGDDNAGTSSGTETAGTSAGEPCQPGSVDACLCPDGSPALQTCLADGSGFGPCECDGGSTGGSASGSASVSASGSASASASASVSASAESSGGDADASGSSGGGSDESGTAGSSSEGPPPECDGSHPLVEGDLRYCDAGNCYCGDFSVEPPFDVCYAEDIADACCPVEVVCY